MKNNAPAPGNGYPSTFEHLLDVQDVARQFKMSESTVRGWCRDLLIDHIKIDRKYLFEAAAVEEFKKRFRRERGSM